MVRIHTTDGKYHHADGQLQEIMAAIREYRPITIKGRIVIFNPEHVDRVERRA